jgi:tetratricopeptide (TPR) repeat protein
MSDLIDGLLMQSRQTRFERPEDAKRDLIQAVALARESNDRLKLAQSLTALGQIERDLHNNEEALRLYEEALEIYRALNDPLKVAHTVRHVGDILRHLERFAAAATSYAEALRIYRAHPGTRPLDLANALRGLARLKEALGENAEAKTLWEEAGTLYAAVNVESGVAESARKVAMLGKRSGREMK